MIDNKRISPAKFLSSTSVLFVDLVPHYNDQHGLYSLFAVLKRIPRVEVQYIFFHQFNKVFRFIKRYRPDLILYSCLSSNLPVYIRFDRELKELFSICSIIGGAGPTYHWQMLNNTTFDAICIGEGETALARFLQNGFCPEKNIISPGAPFPENFYPFVNLDELPFPYRSPVYSRDSLLRQMPSKQFFSGRGCPYHCTYCFNHFYSEIFKSCGPYIRKKSVDYLIREVQDVRQHYSLADVVFNDDVFVLDKQWLFEFAEKFPQEVGLPYTCNVRANLIDEDIVKSLKQSGCRAVNWSIETGDEKLRNAHLKRQMRDDEIYQTADLLAKYKIPYRIGNLLGIPGETIEQMDRTIEMNIRARPYLALANIFVPYPGLELTEFAIRRRHSRQMTIEELPKNYFTKTIMNLPLKVKRLIKKRLFLFPIFVDFPVLFRKQFIRKILLSIPEFFLRPLFEIIYLYKLYRICLPKISLIYKFRIIYRHLRGEG